MRILALLCCVSMLALPPAAHAATEDVQAWLSESISIKASDTDTVTIDASQRARSDTSSGGEQFLQRVTWDHEIVPKVQIGGGFAYVKSEADQEMRFHQQLTVTHGPLQSRTRLEQRFFDYADNAVWRLRERVQLTIPLNGARTWSAVGAGEAFFNLNRARPGDRTGLATFRLQAGLRRRLSKTLDAQLLYMRQQNIRDGRPDTVNHLPWLSFNWRL
nr:DUF2490 domain-containing protein [Sphingobium sp. OAS761]